jgi:hypothetical protein
VTILTHHRAALIGVFTIAAWFAGTAWSVAGPVAKPDYGCIYAPEANSTKANSAKATGDVIHVERCARSDSAGHFHLKRQHLLALDFGRHGLASVYIEGGWYYVRRDGRLAPVMTMDNGAEPFSEGFARSPVGGKIGFINLNLALAIPARYDGALPFGDAGAEVCIDCRLVSRGEHSSYEGGRWACIDHHGHEREPFSPDRGAGHVCRKDG